MFEMHGRTIRISQGDTGIVTFSVEGAQLSSADRAVFTVKGSAGRLIQKVIAPEEGNLIRVPLTNEETDGWRPGCTAGICALCWSRSSTQTAW